MYFEQKQSMLFTTEVAQTGQLIQYQLIIQIIMSFGHRIFLHSINFKTQQAPLSQYIFYSLMFPSVNAKDQSKQKTKDKDKQWEQPLGKSTVPEYSPVKDKHTGSYRKILMGNSSAAAKMSEAETQAQKKIKQKTYFEKKLQLLARIRQKHSATYEQIRAYQDLMNKSGAPNFYSFFNLQPLLNIDDPKSLLFSQTKKLKQKTSAYHRISTSIRAREECIQRLKKSLQKIKEAQILEKKQSLKDQINHLRLLTVNLIEQIKLWRNQLGPVEERPIYYNDDQKNCLIQMLNDNKFVFSSKLGDLINFGQKNDPFLIAPLKKAEGKQQSEYLQIVNTEKDLSHYQKYMQYLASEKAYEMNLNYQSPKKSKPNSVQKIYSTPKLDLKDLNPVKQSLNEDEDTKAIQRQKQRQQRINKNQEKINSIKSIYENYASKKKGNLTERRLPETDTDEKRDTFRVKKQKKPQPAESDFQGLVKMKLQSQKVLMQQVQKKKKKQIKSLSTTKLPKNQDKMIDNLREIQQTLKSKLQIVQKQNKLDESSSGFATTRYVRKNNQDLVKQLKLQIISKIEKENQEKDKLRKKKKEEEEKALEQIKLKMKKQMEEKLEQKKREKMMEREELEKRLKEEQERLNNQRQMEIQLQIKLNKEKQMRQLQKIRRQALQKQKKYKQELEKQQKLRKQKQQAIQREKKEKQRLLEELKKKELKQQIQEDLRREMMDKKKLEDEAAMREEMQAIKKQKQNELAKQIQLLKLKEKEQLNILEKQAAIRERMLKLKKQQQQLKRKQVEALMKNIIQKQKQELDRQALQKRVQLQQSMRSNIKQKMLQQYKNERQQQIQINRSKRQKQLQQQVYRQKVRQKIEREMRMQAIERTKKDIDEREAKKYQMRTKLQGIKYNIQNNHKIDKDKIQDEVKKDVIQRVIFDKNAERENAKMALRAQFEKELLSSAVPQIYQPKDSFLLKHTEQLATEQNLNRRMQLTAQKPTNQRPGQDEKSNTKSQIRDVRSLITNEQLQIYSKQKSKVNQLREQPIDKPPTKLDEQQEQGFELMNPGRKNKGSDNQYDIKIVRKQKEKKQQEEKYQKKKKRKARDQDSEDSDYVRKKKNKKKKRKVQDSESEQASQVDSEEMQKNQKKKKGKKKVRRQSQESEQSERRSPVKKKIQFRTSDQQKQKQKQKQKRKTKNQKLKNPQRQQSQQSQQQQKPIVHYDADKKNPQKQINLSQIEPITIKKNNMKQMQVTNKFEISLDAIPQAQLDQYLQGHFSRLPDDQVNIQIYGREELYRKLIGELTFCLLLGHFQNKLVGMAYAYHDRSRSDIRKFVIVHVGTYKTDDLRQFIINVSNFIFRKDPCDEVQFHYKFDENKQDQMTFSTQFNQWFDKYGNVYQKKLENSEYERKYSLKRQFNQKCQVVLGGINKNTFRNIFSVYAGVMMSDADMVIFKQELRDVISPEDQMSYAIMIAELFRNYLTPDQAEALKGKVKEFVKLKQLLVLVVMLQKKKIKMDELKLYQYKSLIQLNMRLMSQGKDVIRYCKDPGVELNRVFFCQLSHGFNLPFNFQTTSLPVETKQNQIRQISYFRLAALPPYKLHIIKSSIYNGQMNVLPTQNSKYKMFIMNAQEYMELKDSNKMDLFMYIRLFLKNVKSHNVAVWKYVWMPEMMDKGAWNIRQFKSFLNKDIYAHDSVNISYRQFLPGALIIQPEHRDLVITPPFIVGIMSMTLEQVTEGSPLYARLIDIDALRTIEIQN